jgi:hypothetical protein
MKLRIHKNSIRLRLSKLEVGEILEGHSLHETLEIGESPADYFGYHLLPTKGIDAIYAAYDQNQLNVFFPYEQALDWAGTDKISISSSSNDTLSILIEKDFQCLHQRPGEDESANFPNPSA